MTTRKQLSRAEASVSGWRKSLRDMPPLLTRLDESAGRWQVDEPLQEIASRNGFLGNSWGLRELRYEMAGVGIVAFASAHSEYHMQVADGHARERNGIVRSFMSFLDGLADEIAASEEVAFKEPDHTATDNSRRLEELRAAGEKLRPMLEWYVAGDSQFGDATNFHSREFFQTLENWWCQHVRKGWRGEAAAKHRLAVALWVDFGRDINFAGGAENWAKEQFRSLRKK